MSNAPAERSEFLATAHEAMLRLAAAASDLHVAKTALNPQGNYTYASHDDVKRAVSLLSGPLGLRPRIACVDVERTKAEWGKGAAIERYTFECSWMWGCETASDPSLVTIAVYASGAQSFGAAQSYATKEWLKSELLIDTGDPDADHATQTVEPPARGRVRAEPSPGDRRAAQRTVTEKAPLPDGMVSVADARRELKAACGSLQAAMSVWGDRSQQEPITRADLDTLLAEAANSGNGGSEQSASGENSTARDDERPF